MYNPLYEIDDRHVEWLSYLLQSGRFRRVLEIGSYVGKSTQPFLDALDAGHVDEVHLCEPFPQPQLIERLNGCRLAHKVTLNQMSSLDLLDRDTDWDFVFVDGLHTEENVKAELERLLPAELPIVAAHDTGSSGRYIGCEGPAHLKHQYQLKGYRLVEDTLMRPNERTERGFLVACQTDALWQLALDGYRKVCV